MADVDQEQIMDEEDLTISCCNGLPVVSDLAKPVRVGGDFRRDAYERSPFSIWPIFGPLIFVNEASESRDLCATERSAFPSSRLTLVSAWKSCPCCVLTSLGGVAVLSVLVLPQTFRLHGHRVGGDRDAVPPPEQADRTGAAHGQAAGRRLLGAEPCLSAGRVC